MSYPTFRVQTRIVEMPGVLANDSVRRFNNEACTK
jgi:hypothetical protein